MLLFGPGKIVYKYTNQSSKYTNGTFQLKSPNWPGESFYLSIIVERFTMYNLVVLYLWTYLMMGATSMLRERLALISPNWLLTIHLYRPAFSGAGSCNSIMVNSTYVFFAPIWNCLCLNSRENFNNREGQTDRNCIVFGLQKAFDVTLNLIYIEPSSERIREGMFFP